jgi:hypothetical protein
VEATEVPFVGSVSKASPELRLRNTAAILAKNAPSEVSCIVRGLIPAVDEH